MTLVEPNIAGSPGPSLLSIIEGLIGPIEPKARTKASKKKARKDFRAQTLAKARAKEAAPPAPHPLTSSRWVDSSISLITRRLTCSCGATHLAPCENVFIERWHPIYGLHATPIPLREWSALWLLLPRRSVVQEVPIAVCHECFNAERVGLIVRQPPLFPAPVTTFANPENTNAPANP